MVVQCTLAAWADKHVNSPFDVEVYTITRVYQLDHGLNGRYAIINNMVPGWVLTAACIEDVADFLAPGSAPKDIEGAAVFANSPWPKVTPKNQPLALLSKAN